MPPVYPTQEYVGYTGIYQIVTLPITVNCTRAGTLNMPGTPTHYTCKFSFFLNGFMKHTVKWKLENTKIANKEEIFRAINLFKSLWNTIYHPLGIPIFIQWHHKFSKKKTLYTPANKSCIIKQSIFWNDSIITILPDFLCY